MADAPKSENAHAVRPMPRLALAYTPLSGRLSGALLLYAQEEVRVSPTQRRSPRHRTMTCLQTKPGMKVLRALKTPSKHPQNVSGREAFAHFMEIMGSAVVLPLRGESCTELRGEPGAALSCGEGTERVLPILNPFSSRIRMR
jgi:hypothetical protein